MITFISSFEIINVVVPDPKILFWAAAVADATAVNPDIIQTILANGFCKFFIKNKPVFSNGHKSLPKNIPDSPILCNWVFDNFIWAEKQLAKVLQSLKTCVLVNNNSCGKLVSSLEALTTLYEGFKVTSVPIFISNFNLLCCNVDNFTFNVLYWVILSLRQIYL